MKQFQVKVVDNPRDEYWIWDPNNNSKSDTFYSKELCNVKSGQTVALYEDLDGELWQIAQLIVPDYEKLRRYYKSDKDIILNYAYVSDYRWLRDKSAFQLGTNTKYSRNRFSAACSFWNMESDSMYMEAVSIMNTEIWLGNMDFSYAGFNNIYLDLNGVIIHTGNISFRDAQFFSSIVRTDCIRCGGNKFTSPEISYRNIYADGSRFDIGLMTDKLSLDFYLAETTDSEMIIFADNTSIARICLIKAIMNSVRINNAYLEEIDSALCVIEKIHLMFCRFQGAVNIGGEIKELSIIDSYITSVFSLSAQMLEQVNIAGTIITGEFRVNEIDKLKQSLQKSLKDKACDAGQVLVLKENYRRIGEYSNEDLCHLLYQKSITAEEKNPFKKIGRMMIDYTSGYGTKPWSMLATIIMIITAFGMLFYFSPAIAFHGVKTITESIYASGITFFTVGYGDLYPLNLITKIVSLIEAFIGVMATSYFLVMLARKVIR